MVGAQSSECIHSNSSIKVEDNHDEVLVARHNALDLPSGWIKETRVRKIRTSLKKYTIYIDPEGRYNFSSFKHAKRHLKFGDLKKCATKHRDSDGDDLAPADSEISQTQSAEVDKKMGEPSTIRPLLSDSGFDANSSSVPESGIFKEIHSSSISAGRPGSSTLSSRIVEEKDLLGYAHEKCPKIEESFGLNADSGTKLTVEAFSYPSSMAGLLQDQVGNAMGNSRYSNTLADQRGSKKKRAFALPALPTRSSRRLVGLQPEIVGDVNLSKSAPLVSLRKSDETEACSAIHSVSDTKTSDEATLQNKTESGKQNPGNICINFEIEASLTSPVVSDGRTVDGACQLLKTEPDNQNPCSVFIDMVEIELNSALQMDLEGTVNGGFQQVETDSGVQNPVNVSTAKVEIELNSDLHLVSKECITDEGGFQQLETKSHYLEPLCPASEATPNLAFQQFKSEPDCQNSCSIYTNNVEMEGNSALHLVSVATVDGEFQQLETKPGDWNPCEVTEPEKRNKENPNLQDFQTCHPSEHLWSSPTSFESLAGIPIEDNHTDVYSGLPDYGVNPSCFQFDVSSYFDSGNINYPSGNTIQFQEPTSKARNLNIKQR